MLEPGIGEDELVRYISGKVTMRAFNACPPIVIGIGLGGTIEVAAYLAKRSLLRKVSEYSRDVHIARLERKILRQVNQSGIGPGGLGGKTTGIGVHVDTAPSHIASLAVAVNLQCWAVRRGTVVIRDE
jgi:tartrate/fumarate subfamily iron-sulfur-dependent hydro-lyase alpha chain